jgi:BMFP domain-containing protein YqiC
MSRKEELLGRLGKWGSRAFVSVSALRQEMESIGLDRLERLAKRLNLVRRAEFEALQDMVRQARLRQEEIHSRLDALESFTGLKKSLPKKGKKTAAAHKARNESSAKRARR